MNQSHLHLAKILLIVIAIIIITGTVVLTTTSFSSHRAFDETLTVVEEVLPSVISDVSESLNEIFLGELQSKDSFNE